MHHPMNLKVDKEILGTGIVVVLLALLGLIALISFII